MIKLYGFGPFWSLTDLSVFVSIVDAYLRMTKLPYEYVTYPFFDLPKTPKGKLPFIEDAGERIADSGFIIAHLKEKYGDSLDAHLSHQQQAVAHAFNRMMKEHFYWVLVQLRWRIDENWEGLMGQVFGEWRSKPDLSEALPKVRDAVLKELYGQGLGRHSVDEVWRVGMDDIDALAQWLGDKDFMMGQEPSSLDATVYCMLAHLQAELKSPVADHVRRHDNLLGYCDRWRARYYAH